MPSNLPEYIMYLENVVPQTLIDEIFSEYGGDEDWEDSKIGVDGQVIKNVRGAKIKSLSQAESIQKNEAVRKNIDAQLFKCVEIGLLAYTKKFPMCVVQKDTGYDLLKYDAGTGYTRHVDNFLGFQRAVSCSIALNDGFEGGEFSFFNGEVSYKLATGSMLLFPSSFQYPHEVKTVTSGTRYSIVTWFN
jgi:predicted 2-oxoglutarate/Fe(II)-dependent dioxygenase YbiX